MENQIEINRIVLFDQLRTDKIISDSVRLYNIILECENNRNTENMTDILADDYFILQRALMKNYSLKDKKHSKISRGNLWQSYVYELLLIDENGFSLLAEKDLRNSNIEKTLKNDLKIISDIFYMDWNKISVIFKDRLSCVALYSESEDCLECRSVGNNSIDTTDSLYDYYRRKGAGILSVYEAFLWEDKRLKGVSCFDTITFEELIGYEAQKSQLIENTEFLLKGKKGSNVLLFGDRGTGKSSSVKALIHKFADERLKLISVNKNQLTEISEIFAKVENRGCKFILFVDDLSFEEDELEYKSFKSVIEGGLGKQPDNLLIYVTTNRRHLIRETWKDRSSELGDIHQNDGIQERTSLAERFGLTLTYSTPSKQEYLDMIRGLAKFEGIVPNAVDTEGYFKYLESEALKWEVRHNGRSGRTAKQFVNFIKSKEEDIN